MAYLFNVDFQLTNILKSIFPHNGFFDYFFSFFSLRGNSILVWILVIIIALIVEERKNPGISRKDKQFATLFLTAFLLSALIVEFPLKNLFHRQRPISTNYCPTDFSFPSGHATTAFAAATVLTSFNKKRKWLYYLTAILISYSRIYLVCHYFFDITFGAILGIIISKITIRLEKHIYDG